MSRDHEYVLRPDWANGVERGETDYATGRRGPSSRSVPADVPVKPFQPSHVPLDRTVAAGMGFGGFAQSVSQFGVTDQPPELRRKRIRILHRHQKTGLFVLDEIGDAADRGGKYRLAKGHRFDELVQTFRPHDLADEHDIDVVFLEFELARGLVSTALFRGSEFIERSSYRYLHNSIALGRSARQRHNSVSAARQFEPQATAGNSEFAQKKFPFWSALGVHMIGRYKNIYR